jgi:hypothetical protein
MIVLTSRADTKLGKMQRSKINRPLGVESLQHEGGLIGAEIFEKPRSRSGATCWAKKNIFVRKRNAVQWIQYSVRASLRICLSSGVQSTLFIEIDEGIKNGLKPLDREQAGLS